MNAKAEVIEIDAAPRSTSLTPLPENYVAAVTPMEMLDRALASGRDLETIEKLMGLQERWEANQARKAFNEAFAKFKAEAVVVERNRLVTDGPLKNKRYAELVAFVDAATPALSKHGLSASWNITRDEKDWIEVTCTIEHVLGGKKQVALGGAPDTGGAKNQLQARISTVTYLERVTFKAACGLAEQGDDDDGRGGKAADNGGPITDEQRADLEKLLDECDADKVIFCEKWKVDSLAEFPASKLAAATADVKRWFEKQKARANG
jgi:hypothetical protein